MHSDMESNRHSQAMLRKLTTKHVEKHAKNSLHQIHPGPGTGALSRANDANPIEKYDTD